MHHKKIHNDQTAKLFKCDLCPTAFSRKQLLKLHLRTHTGQQPYLCKECGKRFADSSNLAKHKKTHEESVSKSKQTVWDIVKDVGSSITEEEEGEQVIYITYDNEDRQVSVVSETLKESLTEVTGDQQVQLTTKEGAQISLAFTADYFKHIEHSS